MRAMLDQLMGTSRNGEENKYRLKFSDPKVCKSFLLTCCPHEILSSTRMDLGECPKVHDLALRADYEQATSTKDYYYDIDAMEHLQSFITDCDRRTESAKKRLAETQEELSAEVATKANKVHDSAEQIGKKLAKAEQMGADGLVEESMKLMEEVEDLRKKKASAEQEYRNSMPASSYQQQKLRVCEVCSAYLGIHDNDRRLADHFGGKLHLGFIKIREKLEDLKKTVESRREKRREERDQERNARLVEFADYDVMRDNERERYREERDRDRYRESDRRRRRSRSRSRSRDRRRRSRSRDRGSYRSRSRSRDRSSRSRHSRSRDSRERSHRHRRRSRSRDKSSRDRSRERTQAEIRRKHKERLLEEKTDADAIAALEAARKAALEAAKIACAIPENRYEMIRQRKLALMGKLAKPERRHSSSDESEEGESKEKKEEKDESMEEGEVSETKEEKPEVKSESEMKSDSELKSESESKSESEPKTELEPKSESQPEIKENVRQDDGSPENGEIRDDDD